MSKRDYLFVAVIITIGVFLYVGVCKIMGFPLINNPKKIYVPAVATGHEGRILPSIEILLPDGKTHIDISKMPMQRPFVLFYFSPTCPYCQEEMKEIIDNMTHLSKIDFYIITPYAYSEMMSFYNKNDLKRFKNIVVGVDYKFSMARYLNPRIIPYLAIYNRQRVLKVAFQGVLTYDQIKEFSEK